MREIKFSYQYVGLVHFSVKVRIGGGGGGYNILARTTRLAQSLGNVPLIRN